MPLINTEKIRNIGRLSFKAFKQYRSRMILIFILGILSGLSGGIGVATIIPLFSLAAGGLISENDPISLTIRSFFEFLHIPFNLPFLVSFIAVLFVIKGLISFFTKYINDKTSAEYERSMRADLVEKVLHSKWPYLIDQKLGFIERVLMGDVSAASRILIHTSTLILFLTSFVMYAVVAFNIAFTVTLITIIFGALLIFIFKPVLYKTRQASRELANTEKLVTHHISQSILGAKVVKAFAIEDKVIKKSDEYFEKLKKERAKTALYIYSVGSVFEPVAFIFIAGVFFFYFESPNFNIVAFGAVVYLIQKMFAFIQSAQGSIHRIAEATPFLQTALNFRSSAMMEKEESPKVWTSGFLLAWQKQSPKAQKRLTIMNTLRQRLRLRVSFGVTCVTIIWSSSRPECTSQSLQVKKQVHRLRYPFVFLRSSL